MNATNNAHAHAQFMHVMTFSQMTGQLSPSQRKRMKAAAEAPKSNQGVLVGPERPLTFKGKATAREVIGELLRVPDHCPHVENPQTPTCLFGIDAIAMPKWFSDLEDAAGSSKVPYTVKSKKRFRKQRADTPIILGVVASFPDENFKNNPEYTRWRDRAVAWMKNKYGHNLVTIMEHVDEGYGHIHGIVADNGQTVKPLHDGERARMQAKAEGLGEKPTAGRVCAALRKLQDDYYLNVGAPSLQARTSVRRKRFSNEDWRIIKAEKAAIKKLANKVQEEREEADRRLRTADEKHLKLKEEDARVTRVRAGLQDRELEIQLKEESIEKRLTELEKREDVVHAEESWMRIASGMLTEEQAKEIAKRLRIAERAAMALKIAENLGVGTSEEVAQYARQVELQQSRGYRPH